MIMVVMMICRSWAGTPPTCIIIIIIIISIIIVGAGRVSITIVGGG